MFKDELKIKLQEQSGSGDYDGIYIINQSYSTHEANTHRETKNHRQLIKLHLIFWHKNDSHLPCAWIFLLALKCSLYVHIYLIKRFVYVHTNHTHTLETRATISVVSKLQMRVSTRG